MTVPTKDVAVCPERPSLWRMIGGPVLRVQRWICVELLVPLFGFVGLMLLHHPKLLLDGSRHFIGSTQLFPGDRSALVWLLWWRHRAWSLGQNPEFTDRICAPLGDTTLANFPNQLEVTLSIPFMELWGFPSGFNRYVVSIAIFNCMAAWAFFRPLTRWWLLAFLTSFLFGYNAHVLGELGLGRTVTGLVIFFPLVILSWKRALGAASWRGALVWGGLTGGFGGLSVQQYVPYGIFLALGCALLGVLHLIRPERGARGLLKVAVPAALVVGLAFGLPWLYTAQVYAPKLVHHSLVSGDPMPQRAPMWSLQFWQELTERGMPQRDPIKVQQGRERALERMQSRALPWTWLWFSPGGDNARRAFIPRVQGLALLLGALLAGRAGIRWGLLALLGWLLTLGPYASWTVDGEIRWLTVAGQRLSLPLRVIFDAIPFVGEAVRPNRAFSLFYLSALALLVVGVNRRVEDMQTGWTRFIEARLGASSGVRATSRSKTLLTWVGRAGAPLLFTAGLLWVTQSSVREVYRKSLDYRLPPYPYVISPVYAELAKDPEDFILMEFPTGAGYGYAIPQAIHGHRRTEGMMAMANQQRSVGRHSRCYPHPFQQAMVQLEQAVLEGRPVPTISPDLLTLASRDGFRYFLVYQQNLRDRESSKVQSGAEAVAGALRSLLGSPWYSDKEVVVFRLEPPASL